MAPREKPTGAAHRPRANAERGYMKITVSESSCLHLFSNLLLLDCYFGIKRRQTGKWQTGKWQTGKWQTKMKSPIFLSFIFLSFIFLSAIFLSAILLRYQNPHIADVIACRPSDDRIAESLEEIERIAVGAKNVRRQLHLHCPSDGIAISDCSVGGAVPINTVRAGAQYDQVFYSVQ